MTSGERRMVPPPGAGQVYSSMKGLCGSKPSGKGRVSGTLLVREHTAMIDVDHDTKTYTIRYRDSVNLNAKDGAIHPNYNSWIQNLDRNIRAELAQY